MSTMREVAERAGVSPKTVSRVLNNDRHVSVAVRLRVQEAIAELAYVPNLLARTFRSGRDAAIGVAVPDIADPFFAAVVHVIEQEARHRGVAVFVTSLGTDGALERAGIEALLGRQIVGLIATPVAADQSYLTAWRGRTAMVFIDRPPKNLRGVDSVVYDDRGGAFACTSHLLEHGHRRIAFLGDRTSITTTTRRLNGYREAMHKTGAEADERLIRVDLSSADDVRQAVSELFDLTDPPTAVFSSNAQCSIDLIPVLQALDRPSVAVIGFGDFPLAASVRPGMTVVDQDPKALGRLSVSRLFRHVDGVAQHAGRSTTLPVKLILRDSCSTNRSSGMRLDLACVAQAN